jgi:protein-L-isoaspartate(D-aspartate) O-methyltransferase
MVSMTKDKSHELKDYGMYERDRKELVEGLVASGYLKSKAVIDAMLNVERHLFVPDNIKSYAYTDQPLPVGEDQTISAPHMVAMMCELLDLTEGQRVLEIGAGTGYHACVVAHITKGDVYSIEAKTQLLKRARENVKRAGCTGVELLEGDGTEGYEKEAPYDRIYVTAGAPDVPPPLVDQLKPKGQLLIPVGSRNLQNLVQVEKTADGVVKKTTLSGCAFVPLIGKYGW